MSEGKYTVVLKPVFDEPTEMANYFLDHKYDKYDKLAVYDDYVELHCSSI